MATLSQLAAQKQGAIPVSTAMQGESKLAAPTYQVGEKLANDVMGMIGAKNKAVTAINDASVEGAKRVAFDKNKELALYIEDVKGNTNPNDPNSLAEAQSKISVKYAELSNTGFAFPAAMEAFDVGFTSPAAVSVAKLNTGMKVEEIRLLDLENQKQVLNTVEVIQNQGIALDRQQIKMAEDSIISREGELARTDAQFKIADRSTTAFDSKTADDLGAVLKTGMYDAKKGFDIDTQKRIFENNFGGWGTIQDNGRIKWEAGVENKAQEEILRAWSSFSSSMTADEGKPYNTLYYDNLADAQSKNSNFGSNYVPVSEMEKVYQQRVEGFEESDKFLPLTNTQNKDARNQLAKLKNEITKTSVIEKDMVVARVNKDGKMVVNSGNLDAIRGYMEDGREVDLINANTGIKAPVKITASEYAEVYDTMLNRTSTALLEHDVSSEKGAATFTAGLGEMAQLELIQQKQSTVTEKYEPILNSKTSLPSMSPNEINQYLSYERFRAMSDDSRLDNLSFLQTVRTSLAKLDKEDKDYNKKYSLTFSNFMSTEKLSRQGKITSKDMNREITAGIKEMGEGGGRWDIFFNADPSIGASVAFKQYVVNTGKSYNIKGALNNVELIDYGTATPVFGQADMRAFMPQGLGYEPTVDALDSIRRTFNKSFSKSLDKGDVMLESQYDPLTKNFKIMMRERSNTNNVLGTVTARNGTILVDKLDKL